MGTLALHRLAGEEEAALEGLLVPPGGAATIACSIRGSESVARCESAAGSMGTTRQESNPMSSVARASSTTRSPLLRAVGGEERHDQSEPLPLRHLGSDHRQVSLHESDKAVG